MGSRALRDQSNWVLWAVLLTVEIDMLAVGTALYAEGVGMGNLYPYRNYLYLLIAGGLLLSVFRHDLFDVDAVIRQSAVYFCTTVHLHVLFAGAQEGGERVLSRFIPAESQTDSTWTAVTLTAVLFEPIRSWIRTRAVAVLPEPRGHRTFRLSFLRRSAYPASTPSLHVIRIQTGQTPCSGSWPRSRRLSGNCVAAG